MTELPFNSLEFQQAWDEWLQFRKERKLPKYVPVGIKKTLTALVNKSGNCEEVAIKMIEQSIEQNWQGIFEIKSSLNIKKEINGSAVIKKLGTSEARIAALKNW